ncbi:cytochrome c [Teredinibacter turnerae]|uniref:c-type cytochrome n=1 Tax=Teredinibacter turnerae TaxID=2426 RepID=UPI00036B0CE1|nr:cytochrome c [Teredinibacter turnerae]
MKLRFGWLFAAAVLLMIGGFAGWFYGGFYPIGADVPHNRLTYSVLELVREQSVARAARHVTIPENMDSPDRLLTGGADYNDMCAQCHLKPGRSASDFSVGLYPAPPNLAVKQGDIGSRNYSETEAIKRRFWIIKHGIKASGMPAWKYHHDDERIWSMVAFIERLPELSAAQYQILTAKNNTAEHSSNEHH